MFHKIITRLCARYLKRRGYYLVAPMAVEMVLSGHYVATSIGHPSEGRYYVQAPYPGARVVALACSMILDGEEE